MVLQVGIDHIVKSFILDNPMSWEWFLLSKVLAGDTNHGTKQHPGERGVLIRSTRNINQEYKPWGQGSICDEMLYFVGVGWGNIAALIGFDEPDGEPDHWQLLLEA